MNILFIVPVVWVLLYVVAANTDGKDAADCAKRGGHLVKVVGTLDKAVCAKLEIVK